MTTREVVIGNEIHLEIVEDEPQFEESPPSSPQIRVVDLVPDIYAED